VSDSNVLRVNTVEEQKAYRDAVAEILRRIQAEQRVTLLEIAERVDVSLGTISNAANKKTDLCATYLNRLGRAFGPHFLDPYTALSGGRVVPLDISASRDVLPFIAKANLKIAEARDPASPGGTRETLPERAGYLPELRLLQRELGALICQIEGELAA
jgi:transcriptional regulator with XRE-family HTH domain